MTAKTRKEIEPCIHGDLGDCLDCNKPQPTPTLLELAENRLSYAGPKDKTIVIKIAIDTARMIVEKERRSVNAHKEMLEALKVAMQALQHWGDKAETYEKANDPVRLSAHGIVNQAIASAEGKE